MTYPGQTKWIEPRPFRDRPENPEEGTGLYDPETEKVHLYVHGSWKEFTPPKPPRSDEDEIALLRRDRDDLVRKLWLVFSHLSDHIETEQWSDEDLALWGKVTHHSAVQGPLRDALDKNPESPGN